MSYHDNPLISFGKTNEFHPISTAVLHSPILPFGSHQGKDQDEFFGFHLLLWKEEIGETCFPSPWNDCSQRKKTCQNSSVRFCFAAWFLFGFSILCTFFFLRHPGYGYKSRVMSYNTQCPTFKALETSQWLTAEGGSLTLRRVWNLTGYSSSVLLFCLWHKTRFPIKPRYAQWGSGAQGRRGGKGALFCVWPVPSSPRGPNLELACLEMSGN